jgi:hypothetical protein
MEEQLSRLEASETEDVVQSIEEGINDVPPGESPPEEGGGGKRFPREG